MKLLAISDLHVDIKRNRAGVLALKAQPEDWLIVAGDLCEGLDLFTEALGWLTKQFARVIWVPGNHELWLPEAILPNSLWRGNVLFAWITSGGAAESHLANQSDNRVTPATLY